jgi:alpha-L-fucosidase
MEAREGIDAWLNVNGEAIYGTRPWVRYKDVDDDGAEVRYTSTIIPTRSQSVPIQSYRCYLGSKPAGFPRCPWYTSHRK